MEGKTAVVLGATGLTGSALLQELIKDETFGKIVLLVRTPVATAHTKVTAVTVDFDDENDFAEKLGTGDVIFCCVGTTRKKVNNDKTAYRKVDYDIPVNAARLGIQKGFSRFAVISAVGANPAAANFYLQLKGSMEEDIAVYPYQSIHVFRPSLILGKRNEHRSGESIAQTIMPAISFLLAGSLRKYKPIHAQTIAKAMIAAVKTDVTGVNVYHYKEMMDLQG